MQEAGNLWAKRRVITADPGGAGGCHRNAVIVAVAGDNFEFVFLTHALPINKAVLKALSLDSDPPDVSKLF